MLFAQRTGLTICRASAEPLPVFFSQTLYYQFGLDPEARRRNVEGLLREFPELLLGSYPRIGQEAF